MYYIDKNATEKALTVAAARWKEVDKTDEMPVY